VSNSQSKRQFIRLMRVYPVLLLALLGIAYLLGGFSDRPNAILSKSVTYTFLTILLGVAPIGFMAGFMIIGRASDKKYLSTLSGQESFSYESAFDLPAEEMHGYKIARIRGQIPTLTGITGDPYGSEASAVCEVNLEHVPPVKDCQCGFHAFKDFKEAKFELTLHKATFLLDVDLYGLGFVYTRGFRAETQVVNKVALPARCMNCKIFPVKRFTSKYLLGNDYLGWWQWEARCVICSSVVASKNRMETRAMEQALKVPITFAIK
jgi:hypothetical protein